MKKFSFLLVAAFIFRVILAFPVWHPDLWNHADWGIRFWEYGPAAFYKANVWSFTWPNQPPGTMYLFAGVRKLFEYVFEGLWQLNIKIAAFPSVIVSYAETNLYPALLKLPAILADLGIAWLIYKIVFDITKKKKLSLIGSAVWLFNPAVWYNSAVWGQYDAVINFLALLAFYLLIKKKLLPAVLALAVSFYIKASLFIFAPIFIIVALRQKYPIKKWIIAISSSLLAIGLLTLPFSKGEPFNWLYNLYKDKVFIQQLQVITANAFNIWATITGISEQPQTLPFLGLTYQYVSYILFSVFYFPSLLLVYRKQDMKSIVWSLAIAAFTSFMLLTNMHERYLFPLFPYFTVLVVLIPNLFANYAGVSIISVLNLYNFWWVPALPGIMEFMAARERLAPRVFGGLNFLLFLFLYLRFLSHNFAKKKA